jgi:hypothetical protein
MFEIQVEKDGFEANHYSVFHAAAAIALCRTWPRLLPSALWRQAQRHAQHEVTSCRQIVR